MSVEELYTEFKMNLLKDFWREKIMKSLDLMRNMIWLKNLMKSSALGLNI
jgi:hypothetical protein